MYVKSSLIPYYYCLNVWQNLKRFYSPLGDVASGWVRCEWYSSKATAQYTLTSEVENLKTQQDNAISPYKEPLPQPYCLTLKITNIS